MAFVANYPFATIEPNVGVVPVPDDRLQRLAEIIADSATRLPPLVPAVVKFVDIAGLVKGANQGAGLGNKFLSHIREVSIIAHVVRAFVDENIIREGSSDPENDYATIQTELILADFSIISKIKDQKAKTQFKTQKEMIGKIFNDLNAGIPVRDISLSEEEREEIKDLHLLTAKPEIIILNVSEDEYTAVSITELIDKYSKLLLLPKDRFVVVSAKIESDMASLSDHEQKDYLKELGLDKSGLERLIQTAYNRLGLISFLTAGEKEVRAWTIEKGTNAFEASGVIHTDFTKNFIKAEVVLYSDFVQNKGWKGSRENGKARMEGKDYIVEDGDIIEFKIGKSGI